MVKPNKKSNLTVLITGATSDIGSEIAVRFAERGWDVLCHYFSSDGKANELKREIDKSGVDCNILKSDFSKDDQLIGFIDKLKDFKIDSLVNNAGTYVVSKCFSELTIDNIRNTFQVNVFAPIMLSSKIFLSMKEKRFGRIVNISSIAAKYGGSSYSMHYGCSKRALEGMTKTLAKDGAEYNVLVNTIRPGVIDTEFHKKFPKDMEKRISMIPMRKMGMPEDVAGLAYYLGSDENNFMTNEIVTISGGE
ncbi:MAG: SDR family NAD(P)-dependent oxidoreductase [Candidatus Anammoxibacter sp.]